MITKIEEIPVTEESYPFASAERYLKLSEYGYTEKEYYMYGTANVYETVDERGTVGVRTADAPYVNRMIMRLPEDVKACSGNVVVEIINPTSFMEIDRMWILGWKKFVRDGDIYVGITSKPNTIAKLIEFDSKRYGKLSWPNPTLDVPFPDSLQATGGTGDLDHNYETGLFWDMLTDLAWLLRKDEEMNPIRAYRRDAICLTGWSQSGSYLFRYLNSFAYRPDVARGSRVFDGYLAGGGVHSLVIPVNQYESIVCPMWRKRGNRLSRCRQKVKMEEWKDSELLSQTVMIRNFYSGNMRLQGQVMTRCTVMSIIIRRIRIL